MTRDWNELISAYLDDELSPADRLEFERRLERGEVSGQELEEMRAMRSLTKSIQLDEFPDEIWERYWHQTYNRMERNTGWILLSIGTIILTSYGAYEFLSSLWIDPSEPWWLRLAVGCVAIGLSVLFVSVLRERWFVRNRDPYRGIKR